MNATVIRAKWPGQCACGRTWAKGGAIVYNGRATCIQCADRARTAYRDPLGLLGPPSAPSAPVQVPGSDPGEVAEAAAGILRDAPEHLRAPLTLLRDVIRELAYMRCPREAVNAAVLVGREEGRARREAVEARDAGATMLAAFDARDDAHDANEDYAPATAGAGVPLDALAGVLDVSRYESAGRTVETSLEPVRALAQPASSRFKRVAPPAPKSKQKAAPDNSGAPWE